jgi:hypothetical protein
VEQFKSAVVYGKSVKHQPQRVGLAHELEDEDVGKFHISIHNQTHQSSELVPQREECANLSLAAFPFLLLAFPLLYGTVVGMNA